MVPDERILIGMAGTTVSAVGAGMSVTDLQAIISIVVTVSGFIISVLIPLIIKLVKKIKAAKADGKITKEEKQEIASTVKEIIDESSKVVEEVSDKVQKEK
jgi:hypothetical protein